MKIKIEPTGISTKKTQKWINIKKKWKEIGLSSTSHGIPNILRSDKIFFKIFWTFFLIVCSSYCFYSIIKSIQSYYEFEVVTKIEVIDEIPTQFPAVTICNLNFLATDYAKENFKTFLKSFPDEDSFSSIFEAYEEVIFEEENGNYTISSHLTSSYNYNLYYQDSFIRKTMFQFNSMGKNITDDNRKNYSFPLEEFLISCTFQALNCLPFKFDWYYDSSFGNCFTFNSGSEEIKTSKIAGFAYGLKLELYLGNPNDSNTIIDSSGVRVFVHNQTDRPQSSEGIDVSSGEKTNIVINRVFDSKLGHPHSNCRSDLNTLGAFDSDLYRATFKSNKIYSQKKCFETCLHNYTTSNCNCHNPFYHSLNSLKKACQDLNEMQCIFNKQLNFFDEFNEFNCLTDCPLECKKITYSLSTSHSDYPNRKYAKILKRLITNHLTIDDDLLKKSIAAINIYYEDHRYTKVSQIAKMSSEDLMANIGGIFGLCIGISFLSFVEIFEALIQASLILIGNKNAV